ncbi:MAG TPA: type II toxin-antitoxin system RelE/ParE family toxin [Stellaceae bacterium]|nr:type II toxin-antitoxin system RelE/ParE family toxin [Stellaceae bacterium]
MLPGLRSLPYGRYMIFYRISEEEVEIVRVLPGARDVRRALRPGRRT